MLPRVRPLALGLVLLSFQACGEPITAPVPPIDGLWDFTRTNSLDSLGTISIGCMDAGSLSMHQLTDSTAVGVIEFARSCNGPIALPNYPGPNILRDSVHATLGRGVAVLRIGSAQTGASCWDTMLVLAGGALMVHSRCGLSFAPYPLSPAAPLATAKLSVDSSTMVVGASLTLTPDLRSATGARLFLRPTVWGSSATGVVTLIPIINSSSYLATAVGAGTAAITATVEGRVASARIVVPVPVAMAGVGAGDAGSCGLDGSGNVSCWGHGVALYGFSTVPAAVPGVHLVRIGLGHEFACGLTTGGAAYCWGLNDAGQLGNGTLTDTGVPTPVLTTLTFTRISVGHAHACAITAAGEAWCWGDDGSGRLGNASTTRSAVPVAVNGGLAFQDIAAGAAHSCGVTTSGLAYCWGDNTSGMLGDSTTVSRTLPTAVRTAARFSTISAGAGHTCALSTTGAAWCWGDNFAGRLGTLDSARRLVPDTVAGGHRFTALSAGWTHTCALDGAGAAWCWGANYFGQLGVAANTSPLGPVAVSGGLTFSSISAGHYSYSDEYINGGTAGHTCGVTASGAYCWGVNNIGQVGNGARSETVAAPVKVAGQP